MKKIARKKILVIIATYMFVGVMGLSTSTSMSGADFSLNGIEVLANERVSAPPCLGERNCMFAPPCQPGDHCLHRWTCIPVAPHECLCDFQRVSDYGPGGRCSY